MPTPSLILVPARFKTGKLYTPLATTSGGLVLGASGDFNVTRATTATRFNSAGLIESVASGVPRLDYYTSGGTAGCPALLVEPSAQNVALRSAGMEVSGTWQRSNISVTTGTTSPEGLTTAFNIVESSDVTAQTHELAQSGLSVSSGTTYTFSLFIKTGTNNRNIRLVFGSANFVGSPVAIFNPVSGSVVASGDCVASVENYGNGWFRCRMTATADVAGTSFFGVYPTSGTTVSYIGNGSGSVQVWGAQVETGSIATSYIPTTTTAPVTRNADNISLSGAISGCIGQTEGTIYMEVDIRNMAKETYLIRIDEGATSNVLSLRTLTSNVVRTAITAPTFSGTLNISSATFTAGILKIAFAYKSGEIALCVNGANLTANGTFTFGASLNRITLGSNVSASSEFNDRIRSAALYTTRLTNAELAALTTL